jgi:hypothetical protein
MPYLADYRSMRFVFPLTWTGFAYPRNQANLQPHVSNQDFSLNLYRAILKSLCQLLDTLSQGKSGRRWGCHLEFERRSGPASSRWQVAGGR